MIHYTAFIKAFNTKTNSFEVKKDHFFKYEDARDFYFNAKKELSNIEEVSVYIASPKRLVFQGNGTNEIECPFIND